MALMAFTASHMKQRAAGLSARFTAFPPNAQGAFWLCISAVLFTGMTMMIKALHAYPPAMQTFFSQAMGAVLLMPLIVRTKGKVLKVQGFWLLVARGVCAALGVMLLYYAFQKLPLAEANALSFTRGLWIGPLAAIVLKDRVRPAEWVALVIGFVGVIVVARPTELSDNALAQFAAVLSAFLLALSITGIKFLTRRNSVSTLLVTSSLTAVVLMSVPAALAWRWPTMTDFLLLVGLGSLSVMSSAAYIQGMAVGDTARMAPVDYVRMPLAIGAGFLAFHEVPGLWTLGGAVIIVGTAIWSALGKSDPLPIEDPATPI
ncbi:Integral membrane protein DUF6 [Brevundimonas sp. BAL3]|nr:Integral membrane protein DUF6 [Brevundimonas sp. BAL3]